MILIRSILVLEDKDIVQIDATVIIGVLFFLTLSIGFEPSIVSQKEKNFLNLFITFTTIVPFTLSALLAIWTNLGNLNKYTTRLLDWSLTLMGAGFGWLIFVIAVLFLTLYYNR